MRRPLKKKNIVQPDDKYKSVKVAQFINYVMLDGKKSTAQRLVYEAMDIAAKETGDDALQLFEAALRNVSPNMEVRSRRVGGANYQVPIEVRPERKFSLAVRWILEAARGKKGSPMSKRLATELVAASKEEGEAIKKKQNVHAMADANKAFAHFGFARKKKPKLV